MECWNYEVIAGLLRRTGTCFDDALDLLMSARPELRDSAFLVHAIVSRRGKRASHAWVEISGHLYEGFVGPDGDPVTVETSVEEFRRYFTVERETRYTWWEAKRMNCEHDTFGPWEECYRELCVTPGIQHG